MAVGQAFLPGFYAREMYESTADQDITATGNLSDLLFRDKSFALWARRDALDTSSWKRIASLDEVIDPKGICVSNDSGVAAEFARLCTEWRNSRRPSSFIQDIVMHPAYQRIIGLGLPVVRHILRELQRSPDHWFWALHSITGDDPVMDSDAGNLRKMADAWLRWGRERDLC
jgi:hypothetical protein